MSTKEVRNAAKRKPPAAGMGRRKGALNKTTTALKEAILLAAEQVGENGKGHDGLVGYLRNVAIKDVKAYAGLLAKVLPLTIDGTGKAGAIVLQLSKEDAAL